MSREKVDRVLQANDILDVVSRYVDIEKSGKNYKALCPFHDEKTPSFNVNAQGQYFKCFGCGEGGDMIHFLMKIDQLEFPEALQRLADWGGVKLEGGSSKEKRSLKEKLFTVNRRAMEYYQKVLWEHEEGKLAREYLKERSITDEAAKKWNLGMAPSGWEDLLQKAQKNGISKKILDKAGLISSSKRSDGYYDRFRRRLMFPIFNQRGKVVGFGGRVLPGEERDAPKYLNTPENPVFQKRRLLYGWDRRDRQQVQDHGLWVAEGYTDVIMGDIYGWNNIVATLGTSFTEKHVKYFRDRVDEILFMFDADTAGKKAAERTFSLFLEEDTSVKIGRLPEDEDPCSILQKSGKAALEEIASNSRSLIDFRIQNLKERHDLDTIDGKMRVANKILEGIVGMNHSVRKQLILRKLSETLSMEEWRLRNLLKKRESNSRRSNRNGSRNGTKKSSAGSTNETQGLSSGLERATKMLIGGLLVEEEEKKEQIVERLSSEYIPVKKCKYLFGVIEEYLEETEEDQFYIDQLLVRLDDDSIRSYLLDLIEEYEQLRPSDFETFLNENIQYLENYRHKKTLESLKKQMSKAYRKGDRETYQELQEEVSSIQTLIRNVSGHRS